jgi:hypothetical protein
MTTNRNPAPRAPWVAPEIKDLPRLTELTLVTGDIIPGGGSIGGGGGSTVVP